jgi:hypothetical protein
MNNARRFRRTLHPLCWAPLQLRSFLAFLALTRTRIMTTRTFALHGWRGAGTVEHPQYGLIAVGALPGHGE